MTDTPRNAALPGPIVGAEPDFLGALPMDNAVGAIVALTSEVWMLRERLAALEAELGACCQPARSNSTRARRHNNRRALTTSRVTRTGCSANWRVIASRSRRSIRASRSSCAPTRN
jgi:hypothetical protein